MRSSDTMSFAISINGYRLPLSSLFFFLNDPATPDIYPLPLPDPLPIPTQRRAPSRTRRKYGEPPAESTTTVVSRPTLQGVRPGPATLSTGFLLRACIPESYSGVPRFSDRKSTRLNSSHSQISYAVFCLK